MNLTRNSSSLANSGIITIIRYIFNITIVIIGKAGKGLKNRDISVESFVKLSQVRYFYDIKIYI